MLRALDDDAAGGGKAGAGEERRIVAVVADKLLQRLHMLFDFRAFAPLGVHRVKIYRVKTLRRQRGCGVGVDKRQTGSDGGGFRVIASLREGGGKQRVKIGILLVKGEGETA